MKLFLFVAGAVVVFTVAYGCVLFSLDLASDRRGQFGDAFGALNAFFSGLAFAGVAATIYLQGRELELQRAELIEQKRELARSASAQEATLAPLTKQMEILQKTFRVNAMAALSQAYSAALVERSEKTPVSQYQDELDGCIRQLREALRDSV